MVCIFPVLRNDEHPECKQKNPGIEHFHALYTALTQGGSRRTIQELLDEIVAELPEPTLDDTVLFPSKSKSRFLKHLAKQYQRKGILYLLHRFQPKTVLEVGTSKGGLSQMISREFSNMHVTAIDIRSDLIAKNTERYKHTNNISFLCQDANNVSTSYDLVVGLHLCGDLADNVITLASQLRSALICVPCCFGKITNRKQATSHALHNIDFTQIIDYARINDSANAQKDKSIRTALIGYETLLNLDRSLALREVGFKADLVHIAKETFHYKGKSHRQSHYRQAIVACV